MVDSMICRPWPPVGFPSKSCRLSGPFPRRPEWFDTEITLTINQRLEMEAAGRWSNRGEPVVGPSASGPFQGVLFNDANIGPLIGPVAQRCSSWARDTMATVRRQADYFSASTMYRVRLG
jgi:hypothetical protein